MGISSLIRYPLVCQGKLTPGLLTIAGPLLFTCQLAIELGDFRQIGFQELRRLVRSTLVVGEEGFQPEVKAADFIRADFSRNVDLLNTRAWGDGRRNSEWIGREAQI